MNDYYEAEMQQRENDEEMMSEYAEFEYRKSVEAFTDWLYKHVHIGNGKQLVEALENTDLQDQYKHDLGLPESVEIGH